MASVIVVIGAVDQQHVVKAEQELAKTGVTPTVVQVSLEEVSSLSLNIFSAATHLKKEGKFADSFGQLCDQLALAAYGYEVQDVWAILISEAEYERASEDLSFFGPPYKFARSERPFKRLKHYCVVRPNEDGSAGEWLDNIEKTEKRRRR